MRAITSVLVVAALLIAAACTRTAAAGPNGGDAIPIRNGTAYAELLSNADTGEVLVQTYGDDLKTRQPIEREPITVGSGDNTIQLTPHPLDTDPPGMCSRFYGQADWVRGGRMRAGWMLGGRMGARQEFEWEHGWEAGRTHGAMWEAMGEHRRMGPGHGAGPRRPTDR